MAPRLDRSKWLSKTQAKALYCLTDKELDGLDCEERTNPRAKRGPPMRLFPKEQLERAAVARWGSLAGLEAERARRQERREQRTIASYFRTAQQQEQEQQQREQAGAQGGAGEEQAEQEQQEGAMEGGQQQQGGQEQQQQPPWQQQQQQQHQHQRSPAAAGGAPSLPTLTLAGQPSWVSALPPLIAKRLCMVPRMPSAAAAADHPQPQEQQQQQEQQPQRYILYWLKTAVWGHENPALDAAAAAARSLGVPLLVASFLLASHPYASERRWRFLLEGLRDVQAELRQQPQQQQLGQGASGSGSAAGSAAAADPYSPSFSFHPRQVFERSAGWRALLRLASGAAAVVTEDMPVPPDADWLLALAQQLSPSLPIAAVDTACGLPMRLVGKCHEKAYSFRAASESQRSQRVSRVYAPPAGAPPLGPAAVARPALAGLPPPPPELCKAEQLGWRPLDLASLPPPHLAQRLTALLARCAGVDHSVPVVGHLPGGSTAGYARWEAFRKRGLALYAASRNSPMERVGVSRLSAYHHWGMVSPFKVAREAAMDRNAGAAKFLDEFLVWREIGFNLCLHRHALLHSLVALPSWARATLEEHARDPRAVVLPYSALDRGATGDAFWDAAQQQLAKTGELHNNARMTWGKAFLQWAPSPQAALSAALHANHRWALDGCDPASYAGVLWWFGMYDAPKSSPGTPISSSLATRSTAAAARRLPPAQYAALAV